MITGHIGTGKSTAGKILEKNGYKIIDADKISHSILDENIDKFEDIFGKSFTKFAKVDRKKLGKFVFNNPQKLKLLGDFLHPLIKDKIYNLASKLEKENRIYFVDIPLFYEKNDYIFDKVVLIYAPEKMLLDRIISRDNLSIQEAEKRIKSQLDIEIKKQKADYIIENTKDIQTLEKNIKSFLTQIKPTNSL